MLSLEGNGSRKTIKRPKITMHSLNKITLIGYVGNEPMIKTFGNDRKVANFHIATSKSWKDKNNNYQTETEWHTISTFVPYHIKKIEQHLHKGCVVYVDGSIKSREYQDKNNQTQRKVEVLVSEGNQLIIFPKEEKPITDDMPSMSYERRELRQNKDDTGLYPSDPFKMDDDIPF